MGRLYKEEYKIETTYDKNICQCKACSNVFHFEDLEKVENNIFGNVGIEYRCPCCGSYQIVNISNRWRLDYIDAPGNIIIDINDL